MKQVGEFLKATLNRGIFVLFPLLATYYVLYLIFSNIPTPVKPIIRKLVPEWWVFGDAIVDTLAILFLLATCFGVGMVTSTRIGRTIALRVGRLFSLVPGYQMFVRIARIVLDHNDASGIPVVVQRDDARQIGFMIEEIGDDAMVVFFPEAPSLVSGSVEIVNNSLVERLNAPPVKVARVIASYGAGLQTLLNESNNVGIATGQSLEVDHGLTS